MGKYTREDLEAVYQDYTGRLVAQCHFVRDFLGGIAADEQGIRAFVVNQMKITDEAEITRMVARIQRTELDVTPEEGEIDERMSYGVNALRRDEHGFWLADWMMKANLKNAASRTGLFMGTRGAKGDMTEMGRISAVGHSLNGNPCRIYLLNAAGARAESQYTQIRGRVTNAKGEASIVVDYEYLPAGTRFAFEFRWYDAKITEQAMVKVMAAAGNIGLGAGRKLEHGKYAVDELEIDVGGKRSA